MIAYIPIADVKKPTIESTIELRPLDSKNPAAFALVGQTKIVSS